MPDGEVRSCAGKLEGLPKNGLHTAPHTSRVRDLSQKRLKNNSLVDQCELSECEGRLVVFEQVPDFLLTLLHEGRPFESGV